jgi:hypothetical protein
MISLVSVNVEFLRAYDDDDPAERVRISSYVSSSTPRGRRLLSLRVEDESLSLLRAVEAEEEEDGGKFGVRSWAGLVLSSLLTGSVVEGV